MVLTQGQFGDHQGGIAPWGMEAAGLCAAGERACFESHMASPTVAAFAEEAVTKDSTPLGTPARSASTARARAEKGVRCAGLTTCQEDTQSGQYAGMWGREVGGVSGWGDWGDRGDWRDWRGRVGECRTCGRAWPPQRVHVVASVKPRVAGSSPGSLPLYFAPLYCVFG